MIQTNLLGKEAIEYKECPECFENKPEYDIGHIQIYHPFESEPNFSGKMCYSCINDLDIHYCGICDREIFYNNGYRINVRWDKQTETMECVACLQKHWFENGMDKFSEGDFFSDSHLKEHGFNKHGSYFCRSGISYKDVKQEFDKLKEQGYKAIVSIERSGMGFEHHIALWIKKG